MVDGTSLIGEVFVDDGEGGAGGGVAGTEAAADFFDEGGLPGPHLPVEAENVGVGKFGQEPLPRLVQFVFGKYREFHALKKVCKDTLLICNYL